MITSNSIWVHEYFVTFADKQAVGFKQIYFIDGEVPLLSPFVACHVYQLVTTREHNLETYD